MPIMGKISDSLQHKFGDRAQVGIKGERFTADELSRLFERDPNTWVFHDLTLPRWKSANLDHVVCRGDVIVVLDSKCWAPGRYWSLKGRVYRGWERFDPAEKIKLTPLVESLSRFLGSEFVITPLVVIWPSRPGRIGTRYPLLSMKLPLNTPYCVGRNLAPVLRRILGPNTDVVNTDGLDKLAQLVKNKGSKS
jgi:hypothetical protein